MSVAYTRKLSLGDPEVAAIADELIEDALELAVGALSPAAFGQRFAEAAGLYALHLLISTPGNSGGSTSGPVQAESVGQVSKTYALAAQDDRDAWLRSTPYGRRFLEIRDTRAIRVPRIVR